jgi:dipeptidyl aminopeptidase/acylaminoacyl peptidase
MHTSQLADGFILSKVPYTFPPEVYDQGIFRNEYSHLADVAPFSITYASDGLKVMGYYIRPGKEGIYPCLIYNRGGNREFGAIVDRTVINLLCRIASWGYVVVASQYRGNCGGEGQEEFGGADINDVMNLFPLLDADPIADAERIGMYGGSRGGMMTYLAMTKTDRIKAAVIRCGAADLTDWTDDRSDMEEVFRDLIPGFTEQPDAVLRSRSAVYWPGKLCKTTPLLIMHGAADWRVNPKASLKLSEGLLAARHPFRLLILEGADHALSECIPERDRQTREWLDRFVRDCQPLPDSSPHGE